MAMERKYADKRRSFRDLHDRSTPPPLWRMLPQSVPYGVIVEPTNLCNFRCPFCPTGNPTVLTSVGRPKGMMRFELYEKIVADLCDLTRRYRRRVHHLQLFKDGEPLLHPQLPQMVRLVKDVELADSVEVSTNGALLKPAIARALLDAGLDVLRVSVEHVSDHMYQAISHQKVRYRDIRDNVRTLFAEKRASGSSTHIHVKILDTGLSYTDKARFIEDFAPISDSWNVDSISGWSLTQVHDFTLGISSRTAVDGITPRKHRLVCPEPFAKLAINFNGSTSICCADWSHGTVVGDVSRETISDIWNGDRLRDLRTRHLSGQRGTIPACAACDFIEGFPEFAELDSHRAELLDIIRGAPVLAGK
jgi:pyruvate-formate lyase-activating enzyme